jgi:hypothetical protein
MPSYSSFADFSSSGDRSDDGSEADDDDADADPPSTFTRSNVDATSEENDDDTKGLFQSCIPCFLAGCKHPKRRAVKRNMVGCTALIYSFIFCVVSGGNF